MESNLHWKYFLALDEDFSQLSRFIEPCEENLTSYSLELARLVMAATQECDVVLKELCKMSGREGLRNEQQYREHLTCAIPTLSNVKIICPRYQLEFVPFESWSENETPSWWSANNKVKHQRATHYDHANMKHAMSSISGLLVANLFLLKDSENKIWLTPEPKNFLPDLECMSKRTVMHSQYTIPL